MYYLFKSCIKIILLIVGINTNKFMGNQVIFWLYIGAKGFFPELYIHKAFIIKNVKRFLLQYL